MLNSVVFDYFSYWVNEHKIIDPRSLWESLAFFFSNLTAFFHPLIINTCLYKVCYVLPTFGRNYSLTLIPLVRPLQHTLYYILK